MVDHGLLDKGHEHLDLFLVRGTLLQELWNFVRNFLGLFLEKLI